jgi:Protein kinase domain
MFSDDPEQGWKLHVAATILTANRVLDAVAPLLSNLGVLYKVPDSLTELAKLNSGIPYGYCQIGKFLTVYPRTTREALWLAATLDKKTRNLAAPNIPFDSRYHPGSCVYYRYGAFKQIDVDGIAEGHAIRDPEGKLVPDVRDSPAYPEWVSDPFPKRRRSRVRRPPITPLQTTFRAFRALTQRGRGGVFQAFDFTVSPPRICILKEGRRHGEVDWQERDGFWRVRHEGRVLKSLSEAGINVPEVYAGFRSEKNYYLAIEFVDGQDLRRWLAQKRRRISVGAALKLAARLSQIVSRIHAAGWAWRDCKPGNIIITNNQELRPVDFEGACAVGRPDWIPWGTTSYVPPEVDRPFEGQSRLPEDLYAMGAVIYLLLSGRTPDTSPFLPLNKLRRKIPHEVCEIVSALLDPDPTRRPAALSVARRLEALSAEASTVNQGVRLARRASSANLASARRPSYTGSVVRNVIDANLSS